jgi:hypothetical protein
MPSLTRSVSRLLVLGMQVPRRMQSATQRWGIRAAQSCSTPDAGACQGLPAADHGLHLLDANPPEIWPSRLQAAGTPCSRRGCVSAQLCVLPVDTMANRGLPAFSNVEITLLFAYLRKKQATISCQPGLSDFASAYTLHFTA